MLSILIPTFNDDLRPLLQDLCDQIQSLKVAVEIILGDDHSDRPESYANIEDLGPVKLFRNPKNLGRTATRDVLAQKATYQTLLFLDADVIPANEDFLKSYLAQIDKASVVFGGVSYSAERPKKSLLLRWVYGRGREAKTAQQRKRNPYYIISQNLLIKKDVFLSINAPEIQRYGWDNVFSFQLYKQGVEVLHIDNPVLHMGLESCDNYLDKVNQAMNTLVWAERQEMISKDFTSIQKFYNQLNTLCVAGLMRQILKPCLPLMRRQLASGIPSIRVLDLYKFYYFSWYKNKV